MTFFVEVEAHRNPGRLIIHVYRCETYEDSLGLLGNEVGEAIALEDTSSDQITAIRIYRGDEGIKELIKVWMRAEGDPRP